MTTIEQQVADIMARPYHIEIHGTAEDGYGASVRGFHGCFTAGDTLEDAIMMIQDAMTGWLESKLEAGLPIPEPDSSDGSRLVIEMPPTQFNKLARRANTEGVSAGQLAMTYIEPHLS